MLFKGDADRGLQEVRLAAVLFRKVGDRLRILYEDLKFRAGWPSMPATYRMQTSSLLQRLRR